MYIFYHMFFWGCITLEIPGNVGIFMLLSRYLPSQSKLLEGSLLFRYSCKFFLNLDWFGQGAIRNFKCFYDKKNHFSFLFRFQKNISKSFTMPNCKPLFQGLSTITKFCPSRLAMRVLWSLKVMSFSHQLNITVREHCYFSMQMACFNFGSSKSGAA